MRRPPATASPLAQRRCTALRARQPGLSLWRCLSTATENTQAATRDQPKPPYYADLPIDRAGHVRKDPTKLDALARDPRAQLIPLHRGKTLLQPAAGSNGSSSSSSARWKPVIIQRLADVGGLADPAVGLLFLGLQPDGAPVFAAEVQRPEAAVELAESEQADWVDLRREGPFMDGKEASLLAWAGGLATWNRNHVYCGRSGEMTQPLQGGHSRGMEEGHRDQTYPRIDPAVIMLVSCGDYVLLGRSARWAPGRHSLLAGFAEIGETLEMAVAREVYEEARVVVDPRTIRYHSSQPWPFPQSLMVGFMAEARHSQDGSARQGLDLLEGPGKAAALQVGLRPEEVDAVLGSAQPLPQADADELADARWFHRHWLRRMVAGTAPHQGNFSLPGRYAIARSVITTWLEQDDGSACSAGDALGEVEIDEGVFKYVLLRVSDAQGSSKLVVRGSAAASWHQDVLDAASREAAQYRLKVEPLGGGRIEHHADTKVISIYGYSSAFGQAPHAVTAGLVRKWFPLHDVTVSYEGY
ncbi:hypothetical protein WJX72_006897 [[Myrmecia] bisecta]|uniref:NAD(+) diphosphatase n=1 Tax=[Myrmecia] bisecta TaxID=41462 RepID=A0AAW1P4V2_9CHLO